MIKNKQIILIKPENTLLNLNELIINQLNKKNNTVYSIYDLEDDSFKSIDKNVTQKEILNIIENHYKEIKFDDECLNFIKQYEHKFDIKLIFTGNIKYFKFLNEIIVRKYVEENLIYPSVILVNEDYDFPYKRKILLAEKFDENFTGLVYLTITDSIKDINMVAEGKKILCKNYRDYWCNSNLPNKATINSEDIYEVNNFKEIKQMVDFDMYLKDNGLFIN